MNEAELLFTDILETDRLSLCLNKNRVLSKDSGARISAVLKRRIKGEPVQYILGKTEFMGLEFAVRPGVLIPRPETEILVEKAVELVRKFASSQVRKLRILDVGTGSGCIAVSLAKYLPEAQVDAIDISEDALEVAKQNALLNHAVIDFIHGDLFNVFKPTANNSRTHEPTNLRTPLYDLIISNPPYIPSAEISRLQPEIQYEPRLALDGGPDGLDFYRRLARDACVYLGRGGYLLLEMGFGQTSAVKNIVQNSAKFEIIEVIKDYNGIERVMVARLITRFQYSNKTGIASSQKRSWQ